MVATIVATYKNGLHTWSGKTGDLNRQTCCARRILSCQPDFLEQKSALEEAIIASNHICEKYPKFHCECNFIERYWGYAKRETRRRCSYNMMNW